MKKIISFCISLVMLATVHVSAENAPAKVENSLVENKVISEYENETKAM